MPSTKYEPFVWEDGTLPQLSKNYVWSFADEDSALHIHVRDQNDYAICMYPRTQVRNPVPGRAYKYCQACIWRRYGQAGWLKTNRIVVDERCHALTPEEIVALVWWQVEHDSKPLDEELIGQYLGQDPLLKTLRDYEIKMMKGKRHVR